MDEHCPSDYIPDFVKVAEANHVKGLRVSKPSEVVSTLKKGLQDPGPVLMEFMVSREENVYPMVSAGKPLTDILTGEE
jgi:acetolactate synthase-1/2/3 large subunit